MLYISNIMDDMVEITDTSTNTKVLEPKKTLYSKYNKKVVEGLTFTPKRKQPKITIATPVMLMLNRIPIGQVLLLRRNANIGFEHCIKIRQTKNDYEFYSGGGKTGLFVLTKAMLVMFQSTIVIDVTHVDENVAALLKQDYKRFISENA